MHHPRSTESAGLLRLHQIIGSNKTEPPTPALIPVSHGAWWEGVRSGRFPKPVKLGPRTTAWRARDIWDLVEHGVEVDLIEAQE